MRLKLGTVLMAAIACAFLAMPALAQPKKGPAAWLFHKVVEGKPLPIKRIGPDPDLNPDGFAVYREGEGGYEQYHQLVCDIGVTEMYVLSGNGEELEIQTYNAKLKQDPAPCKKGDKSKGVTVPFGRTSAEMQHVKDPLSESFLKQYNQWVSDAKKAGKKIAFRCNCGCHRTGRLASYTEMKFFGATPEVAEARQKDAFDGGTGKFFARKYAKYALHHQVLALYDHLQRENYLATHGQDPKAMEQAPPDCRQKHKFCVHLDLSDKTAQRPSSGSDPVAADLDGESPPLDLKQVLSHWNENTGRCNLDDLNDLAD